MHTIRLKIKIRGHQLSDFTFNLLHSVSLGQPEQQQQEPLFLYFLYVLYPANTKAPNNIILTITVAI